MALVHSMPTLGVMGPRNRFSETIPLTVDGAALGRDLYLLLACVLSSKGFAEQTYEKDYDVLQALRDSHEQREVGSLLLSIAVRVRVLDDRGKISKRAMALGCGSLVAGAVRGKDKIPLTLREACNKIVHSRSSQLILSHFDNFDAQLPSPTSTHMEPSLMLHGTKNRKTWRASLDLVKFVRAILSAGVVHDA